MKFSFGVASIVFGYALLYQGLFMSRQYDPNTGQFKGFAVPPLGVLLGFVKPPTSKEVFDKQPPSASTPFSWGS